MTDTPEITSARADLDVLNQQKTNALAQNDNAAALLAKQRIAAGARFDKMIVVSQTALDALVAAEAAQNSNP